MDPPPASSSASEPRPVPRPGEGQPTRSPVPEKRRARKRRWGRIALFVLPVLLLAALLYYWFFMRPYESTDDAFIEAHVTPLAPRVPGQVSRLLVDDNQPVKQGEVLLELELCLVGVFFLRKAQAHGPVLTH